MEKNVIVSDTIQTYICTREKEKYRIY